jgi:outer membrane lipoprotein-sorting protein
VQAIIKVTALNGNRQQLKMLCDRSGRQRLTVLLPVYQAGLEILMLGDTTEIYQPDSRTLHITPSPGGMELTVGAREKLLKENYDVTVKDGYYLAGQKAVRLTARSHHSEVGSVELFVDPETQCVLRIEHRLAGEKAHVLYETLNVSYPAELPDDAFELKVDATVVKDSVPVKVSGRQQARRLLGANPIIPKRLPLGFHVTRMYFSESQVNVGDASGKSGHSDLVPVKALDMQITDGLLTATIHEIRKDEIPAKVMAMLQKRKHSYAHIGDLVLAVRGDLGPKAQEALLRGLESLHAEVEVPTARLDGTVAAVLASIND